MLSNAIEDWLIEKRKKREAEWQAREAERRAQEEAREAERRAQEEAREAERTARDERLRSEAVEYGKLVATCEARGEDPPPPPWASNQN